MLLYYRSLVSFWNIFWMDGNKLSEGHHQQFVVAASIEQPNRKFHLTTLLLQRNIIFISQTSSELCVTEWVNILFALYRVYLPKSITHYYLLSGVDFAQFLNLSEIFLSFDPPFVSSVASFLLSPICIFCIFSPLTYRAVKFAYSEKKEKKIYKRIHAIFCFSFPYSRHAHMKLHVVRCCWATNLGNHFFFISLCIQIFWNSHKVRSCAILAHNKRKPTNNSQAVCVCVCVCEHFRSQCEYVFFAVVLCTFCCIYFVNCIDFFLWY